MYNSSSTQFFKPDSCGVIAYFEVTAVKKTAVTESWRGMNKGPVKSLTVLQHEGLA
jgi:hypothetical protein